MPRTSVKPRKSDTEKRVQDALEYIEDNPAAKIAVVAREFGVTRQRLQRRMQGVPAREGHPAANTKLTREQEVALCRYIDRLDSMNLAVRPEFITDAANHILKESASRQTPQLVQEVGLKWTTRFIQRHGYTKKLQTKMSANRQASEDVKRVLLYFQQLQSTIKENGIPPDDIWNMDETGFRIGMGKDSMIITKRSRAHLFAMPENRESATAIEAISAGGKVIPAFLILSGQQHMEQWYRLDELNPHTKIVMSESGYTNDEITFQWLQHFQQHAISISSKRLLIVDGHGSHHTIEFIKYCEEHNIIPFGMPPHLTHILQPLNVVVFQPLKHYHAKALDLMVRDGVTSITKLEFLSCIEGVRNQAFKKSTILSAFLKTGISPFNPQPVIQMLKMRAPVRTPSPPISSYQNSSDFETPITLRHINKLSNQLRDSAYNDSNIDEGFAYNIDRFVRGALILATELVQTKRDLGRTKAAQVLSQQRRASKNRSLKSGGILSVANGRQMVKKREQDDLDRAHHIIATRVKKARNHAKRVFLEAVKAA